MALNSRKLRFYFLSFLKHDFKASITVFFVALPLCLGISLASGAPFYSGLLAGIIGGLVVSLISGSQLSVSGPAAGLTTICTIAITQLGGLEIFFLSVAIAGILQILLGLFRLGGFTHFIPSAVIKGMLTAIGIILIAKQIPFLIGYDQPDFWSNEFFNIIRLNHLFSHLGNLYEHISPGAILIAGLSLFFLITWKNTIAKKIPFLPASFATVVFGIIMAILFKNYLPSLELKGTHFVNIPKNIFSQIKLPDLNALFSNIEIWRTAVVICFVATLETLLSIEAIDKLDPYNRITPQNRELVAQGTGNFLSGMLGGIPITAVIVRSSANAEAGAKTRLSGFAHGLWLLLVVLFGISLVNFVPYCVLAVILIRTGYNLAKPRMIWSVYKQGREQFLPFIITVIAILFTDLLIGVLIGLAYSIYFLVKHTYRAGFTIREKTEGHTQHFTIELALNVSFLNKRKISDTLDKLPPYCIAEIIGSDSVYIDNDILEIFQDFKKKAHNKHIQLILKDIPEVETIELH
ncbi:MAG: SulP family inorganic anion transporter [Chitinophagaceae bacterium]|nr:SulP family inorganic anion transporter [Chitinophagaceae bacterium]MBL0056022.1 SulP family inorganic anion transporter [Chitinophagaceae bacterium]